MSEKLSRCPAIGNEDDISAFDSSLLIRLLLFFILSLQHQIINVAGIKLIRDLLLIIIPTILIIFDQLLLSLHSNSAFLLFFISLFLDRLSLQYFYYLLFNLLLYLLLIFLILLVVNHGCFVNIFFYNLFVL